MAQKELEFEQALQRLEAVVKKHEAGNVSLDEALAGYEEGISLVRFCNEKLDAAELRVDAVRMTEEGASIAPFDKE